MFKLMMMKLYLWDQAAADFCAKFKSHGSTPRVILVTTVNPKRFGGALALASMSSSRVFLDFDVQPTRDYVRSSAKVDKVLFFRDLSFGIQEGELRFRLILGGSKCAYKNTYWSRDAPH
ncbi:hypothetical protein HID58_095516 [Brassica napus]|uniref:Uncharacterized protein n=1 Tax=Brassica napus TaxID=3708 RepID=A0ABQ7X4Z0_BRANA|nr:hypothetical protein HID58_095516 [Brassica napus]